MKIAWAFNPFDSNRKLEARARAILAAISGPRDAIEAVYVASPAEVALAMAFDVPLPARLSSHPRRLVEQAMRRLGLPRAKASVLTEESLSIRAAARALSSHLERRRADLTLVASHARTGVPRLFLGSFAETLVHEAHTDLLVFREDSREPPRPPRSLLYAHDGSRSGDRGLEKAVVHARRWGAALHLIHVPDPAYGIRFAEQDPRVDAYRRRLQRKFAAIEARLARSRLGGSAAIDAEWAPIRERILARAKAVRADLVLVFARSGPLASLMGGSVTRQILRSAPSPVLVMKG